MIYLLFENIFFYLMLCGNVNEIVLEVFFFKLIVFVIFKYFCFGFRVIILGLRDILVMRGFFCL